MGTVRQLEYYRMGEEAVAWGTAAAAFVGIAPDEYSVELENEPLEQEKFTGEIDTVYVDVVAQLLAGAYVSQVWPDNIARLLDIAGLPRTASYDLKSYTVQCFDKAKNEYLQHTGLKADSVTIAASGSDPKVKFSFDMIGCTETTVASFVKPSLPAQAAFEFSDATFTVNTVSESNITEFSIAISNNLSPSEPKDTNRNIKWIDAGRRQIEVTFTVRTDATMAAHYRSLVRSRDRDLAFVVVFNYPGTGSPVDTLTLTMSKLVLKSVVRTGSVGDIQTLVCTAVARKPAATDAIVAATT
jgi:hypothetical protein